MTIQENVKKYKEEYCKNCKVKDKQYCEIRVFQNEDVICTKCIAYEKED